MHPLSVINIYIKKVTILCDKVCALFIFPVFFENKHKLIKFFDYLYKSIYVRVLTKYSKSDGILGWNNLELYRADYNFIYSTKTSYSGVFI